MVYSVTLLGRLSAFFLSAIVLLPKGSLADDLQCQNALELTKRVEATVGGGVGDLCVQNRTYVYRVCAPDGSYIVHHSERVVAMDNAIGSHDVDPIGANCIDVRLRFHSQDHRRLGPPGWNAFPWICGPAHMVVNVTVVGCPS